MRTSLSSLATLVGLALLRSSASAVTIDWVEIGDPGNAADTQVMQTDGTSGYGAVAYVYQISKYEVTNAQYAEFLNAVAATDANALYNTGMGSPNPYSFGGITRSGASGSYTYSAIMGRENMPVNYVGFYDALRFANWLHNGQGSGNTETGAYTLLGGGATPSNGETVTRNPGATVFLPSEDEWYKAAYYDALSQSYFDYPAGTDAQMICTPPSADENHANCEASPIGPFNGPTDVGSYTGSVSPYGTFDQGGNVWEWNEAYFPYPGGSYRGVRGGNFFDFPSRIPAAHRSSGHPIGEQDAHFGFRVASIPEPSTGLLVITGLLGLAGWRRARA